VNTAQARQEARRLKFTQLAVERLRPPGTGRVIYWDTLLTGFGLRVSTSGRKTWLAVYRINGKQKWETIGATARIPKVADARVRARQIFEDADRGMNPVQEHRATTAAPSIW
jgi:Arm DNA-binding domain